MNFSPGSLRRGSRKPPPPPPQQSDIYSTFIVHNENKADSPDADIYSTMIHKPDNEEDEEEEEDEDESLPPLLKRLPKDFGLAEENDDFNTASASSISGTMIVKTTDSKSKEAKSGRVPQGSLFSSSSRKATSYWDRSGSEERSYRRRYDDEEEGEGEGEEDGGGGDFGTFVVKGREEDEEGGDFGTFVVKGRDEGEEDVSGTMVRKTGRSRGGGEVGSTMSRAVASMQAAGEGFGRQRRSGAGGKDASSAAVLRRQQGSGKVSTSSIPESVTREDPTTKYEILNELGKYE